jgi:hypothetical protein
MCWTTGHRKPTERSDLWGLKRRAGLHNSSQGRRAAHQVYPVPLKRGTPAPIRFSAVFEWLGMQMAKREERVVVLPFAVRKIRKVV